MLTIVKFHTNKHMDSEVLQYGEGRQVFLTLCSFMLTNTCTLKYCSMEREGMLRLHCVVSCYQTLSVL